MKISGFFSLLFLIYQTTLFCSVTGQAYNIEKSDCTKLYNFFDYVDDSEDYANNCCSDLGIECDSEGYITELRM